MRGINSPCNLLNKMTNTQTKLKTIMSLNNSNLKVNRLSTLAFKTFPNSQIQKSIIIEIDKLIKLGFNYI